MSQTEKQLIDSLWSKLNESQVNCDYDNQSEVASFYKDKSVLITGATGFLGKFIVEKLIRSCPDIKNIYIIIREKKGRSVEERLDHLIENSQLFDRIKSSEKIRGEQVLRAKLRVIKGDVTLPVFGISEEDMNLLSKEVSIVFNSAATVRFDDPLDVAVRNNIYSVSQLVQVCNRLENLKAILHISTAYSNCHKLDPVYEIFYEPPMRGEEALEAVEGLKKMRENLHSSPDWRNYIELEQESNYELNSERDNLKKKINLNQMIASDDQDFNKLSRDVCFHQHYPALGNKELDLLDQVTKVVLKKTNRPNTYTLTKAISENYLLELCSRQPDRYLNDKIPLAIVRPSIIGSALREPFTAFVDSFNGPSGPCVGLYLGFIQGMPGNGEKISDLIPVDVVSNMLICAGYYLTSKKPQLNCSDDDDDDNQTLNDELRMDKGAFVFNICSSYRNPVKWHMVTDTIRVVANIFPTKLMFRIASSYFIQDGKFYAFYELVNHKLVAYLVDFVRVKILRQSLSPNTSAFEMYKKFHLISRTLCTFSANEWCFQDRNVHKLLNKLSPIDRELFMFDVGTIDWQKYLFNYVLGLRLYILKDAPESLPKAVKSLKK